MAFRWTGKEPKFVVAGVGCPLCGKREAERIGDAVEPGSNERIGDVYGCLRCRLKFSVIDGKAEAWGSMAQQLVERQAAQHENGSSARTEPLLQRDPDMRWDRRR